MHEKNVCAVGVLFTVFEKSLRAGHAWFFRLIFRCVAPLRPQCDTHVNTHTKTRTLLTAAQRMILHVVCSIGLDRRHRKYDSLSVSPLSWQDFFLTDSVPPTYVARLRARGPCLIPAERPTANLLTTS